ncbi:MAG: hypothetical protein ACK5DJ_10220 [Bacteroidota bacterium]
MLKLRSYIIDIYNEMVHQVISHSGKPQPILSRVPLGGRLRFASEVAQSSLSERDPEPFKEGDNPSWCGLIRV